MKVLEFTSLCITGLPRQPPARFGLHMADAFDQHEGLTTCILAQSWFVSFPEYGCHTDQTSF